MPHPCSTNAGWPNAVIFDLDGTLIDSAPDIAIAVNRALGRFRIEIDAGTARRYLGDGARRLLARVLETHGHTPNDAQLSDLTDHFSACYAQLPCRETRLYRGAESALARLKQRGTALAICTNKPQTIADRVVSQLGLSRYIDVVVGAGGRALKPDPEPLHACLGALGRDCRDALYIGDMAVDCRAARAAGLPVLIADFGYSAAPAAELGADGVLADWASLDRAIVRARPRRHALRAAK